jgi:hypothetical protein
MVGDAKARQRLLELTRSRLMGHAWHFLHGSYFRDEPRQPKGRPELRDGGP